MIGDKDLLDVWDDGDGLDVKLRLLARMFADRELRISPGRRLEALRLAAKLYEALR